VGLDLHSAREWIDRLHSGQSGCGFVISIVRQLGLTLAIMFSGNLKVATAQEPEDRRVTVEAEELPSAYGAPPDLSHGRISTLTRSYVLAPFSFEVEAAFEQQTFRHDTPAMFFGQEIEMGCPARFTVGLTNDVAHFHGDIREHSFGLEARYALADWDKLPLNPTISAGHRFGIRSAAEDSGELALLVSHSFPNLVEWALNVFVDHGFSGKAFTTAGFAQSVEIPLLLPEEKLEMGIEMQYRSYRDRLPVEPEGRGFVIGPTLAWRPTKHARFDLSPLIGCTHDAPAVQLFAIFSVSLGNENEAESPASARGH
jgi:hypothetical protein